MNDPHTALDARNTPTPTRGQVEVGVFVFGMSSIVATGKPL